MIDWILKQFGLRKEAASIDPDDPSVYHQNDIIDEPRQEQEPQIKTLKSIEDDISLNIVEISSFEPLEKKCS